MLPFPKYLTDYLIHCGLKVNVIAAAVLGAGSIVFEYYNGSVWKAFNHMVTDSNAPYSSHSNTKLELAGSYQIRYSVLMKRDWVKTIIDEKSRFWIRMRVDSTITQSFTIDHLKLHTSRTEINSNGFLEYFGNARPVKVMYINYGSFHAANDSPDNQDVYLSDYIGVGRVENKFTKDAIDRTGFVKILPLDIDTSCPLKVRMKWIVDDNIKSGDAILKIRWGLSKSGTTVSKDTGGSPTVAIGERSFSAIITIPVGSQYKEIITDAYLDIPEAIAELSRTDCSSLWISVERTGSLIEDNFDDDVIMHDLEAYYVSWREGGNEENF